MGTSVAAYFLYNIRASNVWGASNFSNLLAPRANGYKSLMSRPDLTSLTYSNKVPVEWCSQPWTMSVHAAISQPIQWQNFLGICSTTVEFSSNWDEDNLLPCDFSKTVETSSIPGCEWNINTCQLFNVYYLFLFYFNFTTFSHPLIITICIPFILNITVS